MVAPLSMPAATTIAQNIDNSSLLLESAAMKDLTPLERARALAAAINKNPVSTSTLGKSSSILPPIPADVKLTPEAAIARAKQIAMHMAMTGISGEGNPDMHFSDEFEINDYPPQVITYILCVDQHSGLIFFIGST